MHRTTILTAFQCGFMACAVYITVLVQCYFVIVKHLCGFLLMSIVDKVFYGF